MATLASMVEIPKGVWMQPLEIEQSYEEVHKRKTESLVLTIKEKEVPWYYDIVKFLELGVYPDGANKRELLRLMPLNSIVWYYVWYYVWTYVWLNVVINKVFLLLSKIMVTWIFRHYHIVYEMHNMWFMWFSHKRYKSQVLCKLKIFSS